MNNKIHIYKTPKKTAEAVAKLLFEKINQKDEFFSLAVSGGNTPNILFEILAEKYSQKIHWEKIKIFWVDERCVPAADKESNYGMMYYTLLKNVSIPDKNIFRIKGENSPENEVFEYQKILNENVPHRNNLPFFDLILLGMGDDGHTASIFPDNLSLLNSTNTVAVATHPVTEQKRITLNGNVIRNSNEIFFLITGSSKKEILNQILTQEKSAEKYPSYHILKATNAEIFADKEVVE